MTKTKSLTITLTDRAPVRIRVDAWPLIASSNDHDNQYEFQANRRWQLYVRQHADGRALIYGWYTSAFQHEPDRAAGELLAAGADIAAAIRRVAADCDCETIAAECIADLPPEDLDSEPGIRYVVIDGKRWPADDRADRQAILALLLADESLPARVDVLEDLPSGPEPVDAIEVAR